MPIADPDARRRYQREWVARRRAEFFADKCCLRCGAAAGLELHHFVPGEKVHHAIWSWSEKRRQEEIAKCVVLCRDCHTEYHAETLRRHGTRGRYERGCRCEPCREAKRVENAAYRRRKLAKTAELALLGPAVRGW